MTNSVTSARALPSTSPQAGEPGEDPTTTKTKAVLEFFMNTVRQAETSVKGLAGRVNGVLERNKRAALITAGIALFILGMALGPAILKLTMPVFGYYVGSFLFFFLLSGKKYS